jgi:hypothetical protein
MKASVKPFHKLLPPLPPDEEAEPNLMLKAYFCAAALQGHLASENGDGAGWLQLTSMSSPMPKILVR